MSLGSVLQTARSGMSAAAVAVETVSHNLANSRTNGYKASRPEYVTQATSSMSRGNGTAIDVGMGVQVTGFVVDESQRPLVVPDTETDVAELELTELSNTDVGSELVELILAENEFLANADVFESADDLLVDLIHLRRERW